MSAADFSKEGTVPFHLDDEAGRNGKEPHADQSETGGKAKATASDADLLSEIGSSSKALLNPSKDRLDDESGGDFDFRQSNNQRDVKDREDAVVARLAKFYDTEEQTIRLGMRLSRMKHRPKIRTLQEVIQNPPPPIQWIVPNFIREGLTLITADPKKGKSTLMRGVSLAVARGGVALGEDVEKGDVLLVSLEDPEATIKTDFEAMSTEDGGIPRAVGLRIGLITLDVPPINRGLPDVLEGWIHNHPQAKLVVIDCYGRVSSPNMDRKDYETIYGDLTALKRVGDRHHLAVVLIHHSGKKAKEGDPIHAPLGSQALAGASDMILHLGRSDGGTTLNVQGRGVEEKDYTLKFNFPTRTYSLDGEASQTQQVTVDAAIIDAIKERGAMTPKGVWTALDYFLEGRKPARPTIRKHLLMMVENKVLVKVLVKEKEGKYELKSRHDEKAKAEASKAKEEAPPAETSLLSGEEETSESPPCSPSSPLGEEQQNRQAQPVDEVEDSPVPRPVPDDTAEQPPEQLEVEGQL
ncbi:MAG: AAA family ATPase [Planctomycetota bacterium]|nr:AAA family ATPase [Planctomycetota bacterium]